MPRRDWRASSRARYSSRDRRQRRPPAHSMPLHRRCGGPCCLGSALRRFVRANRLRRGRVRCRRLPRAVERWGCRREKGARAVRRCPRRARTWSPSAPAAARTAADPSRQRPCPPATGAPTRQGLTALRRRDERARRSLSARRARRPRARRGVVACGALAGRRARRADSERRARSSRRRSAVEPCRVGAPVAGGHGRCLLGSAAVRAAAGADGDQVRACRGHRRTARAPFSRRHRHRSAARGSLRHRARPRRSLLARAADAKQNPGNTDLRSAYEGAWSALAAAAGAYRASYIVRATRPPIPTRHRRTCNSTIRRRRKRRRCRAPTCCRTVLLFSPMRPMRRQEPARSRPRRRRRHP